MRDHDKQHCFDSMCTLPSGHRGDHLDAKDGVRWENFSPPATDPHVEEADANPERRNNGCMVYRVGQ